MSLPLVAKRVSEMGVDPVAPEDSDLIPISRSDGAGGWLSRRTTQALLQIKVTAGLGSAALEPASAFATAAQGALADTAVQPAAIANMFDKSADDSDDITEGSTNLFQTVAERGLLAALDLSTRAAYIAAIIHADVDKLYTIGYAAIGDAPPAVHLRVGSEPSHDGKFSTNGGTVWWELRKNQPIHLEHFGASTYTQAELVTLNGHASIDAAATATVAAHAAANAFLKHHGGGTCYHLGQFYVIDDRCEHGNGVFFVGAGTGYWDPVYPGNPKSWEGTTFLCKGTFTRDVTFPGITSMEHGGGWVEDPDNATEYFKLWSAYNRDASGTTPATLRLFSVAFKPEETPTTPESTIGGGFQNFRIVNWNGTDGISDWSNTGSTSLGADIDFGHVHRFAAYTRNRGLQIMGGWREFAHAAITPSSKQGSSERNLMENCQFQGRVGTGIRGPDRWHVTAATSNSVTIRFSLESYWPTSGTFRGSDNATYTYTGVTHSGTDADFVFTGVTPNPSAIVHVRHVNVGYAGTQYINCQSYDIAHHSGSSAATLGFTERTKCYEASGFPVRGIKYFNHKFHRLNNDTVKVAAQIHDAFDLEFIGYQVESGGHFLASPIRTDAVVAAAAQVGETRNLMMGPGIGMVSADLRLFHPRSGEVEELQRAPDDVLTGDYVFRPLRDNGVSIFQNHDETEFMRMAPQSWTPTIRFVDVTHGVRNGTYQRFGDLIVFNIVINWTDLDTADTSAFDISLPVNPDTARGLVATINERLSTGVNFSSLTNPFADVTPGPGLGWSHNRTTRVTYNAAGVVSASGAIYVSGHYWAA